MILAAQHPETAAAKLGTGIGAEMRARWHIRAKAWNISMGTPASTVAPQAGCRRCSIPSNPARQAPAFRAANTTLDTSLLRLVVRLYCLRLRLARPGASSQSQIYDLLGCVSGSNTLKLRDNDPRRCNRGLLLVFLHKALS